MIFQKVLNKIIFSFQIGSAVAKFGQVVATLGQFQFRQKAWLPSSRTKKTHQTTNIIKLASLLERVVLYLANTTANVYTMNASASQQYLKRARCLRGFLELVKRERRLIHQSYSMATLTRPHATSKKNETSLQYVTLLF